MKEKGELRGEERGEFMVMFGDDLSELKVVRDYVIVGEAPEDRLVRLRGYEKEEEKRGIELSTMTDIDYTVASASGQFYFRVPRAHFLTNVFEIAVYDEQGVKETTIKYVHPRGGTSSMDVGFLPGQSGRRLDSDRTSVVGFVVLLMTITVAAVILHRLCVLSFRMVSKL